MSTGPNPAEAFEGSACAHSDANGPAPQELPVVPPFMLDLRAAALVSIETQLLASSILDEVFDRAAVSISHRFFDRLAIPYAVNWAGKQMLDALVTAFAGPDTGGTNKESWHADPQPLRAPLDSGARGTLHIRYRPPPPRLPTPVDDLGVTTSIPKKHASGRKRSSNTAVLNARALRAGSAGTVDSASCCDTISPSRDSRDLSQERHANSDDALSLLSGDAPPTSGSADEEHPTGRCSTQAPASLPTPRPEETVTTEETPESVERSALRARAEHVEKQLAEILRAQAAAAAASGHPQNGNAGSGNSPARAGGAKAPAAPAFVVDVISGQVVLVKPVDTTARKDPIKFDIHGDSRASKPHTANYGGVMAGVGGDLHAADGPTKSSSRSSKLPTSKRGGGAQLADFYHAELGQQMVCDIPKPALGVALREGDREVRSQIPPQGFGEGRIPRSEFQKIRYANTNRLQSSEGFRDYFPGQSFNPVAKETPVDLLLEESRMASVLSASILPPAQQERSAQHDQSLDRREAQDAFLAGMSPLNVADGMDADGGGGGLEDGPGGLWSSRLPMHQQFHQLMAKRSAAAKVVSRSSRLDPIASGVGRKHASSGSPPPPGSGTTSSMKVQSVASLPIRRPDLLPPLHGGAASPSASPLNVEDEGRSSGVAEQQLSDSPTRGASSSLQAFVLEQKSKDAPHFRQGKMGGGASVSQYRKDALELLQQQQEIHKQRRPTRVVVSPTPETGDA